MTDSSSQKKFIDTLFNMAEKFSFSDRPDFLHIFDSIPDSPEKDKMFDGMEAMLRTLINPSALSQTIPQHTTEATIAKELAKQPESLQTFQQEQLQLANQFAELLVLSSESESVNDMEEVRRFANAEFPITVDQSNQDEEELITLLNSQPESIAEFMQAMMACDMAGMTKTANLLKRLFAQHVFVNDNENYQSLQTDITEHKGQINKSSKAGKSGRNKRYGKRDKVMNFAITLYNQRPYQTPHQAAQLITGKVLAFAESVGYSFSSPYQATRTINTWLGKHQTSKQ
ncbi:hypothetical protein [Shewanella scandinavica]|uniref:hypothetical protein n=1 Tax=Shewanella scandinavica TaxID=3063538 RepID=UPI003191E6ED